MTRVAQMLPLAALVLASAVAHADAEEWRFGVSGGGVVAETEQAGVPGQAFGFGVGANLSFGLANWLDGEVAGGFSNAGALKFEAATVDGKQGNLFGTLRAATFTAGFRLHAGVAVARFLDRTQPFLTVRGGILARDLMDQELLKMDTNMLISNPASDLRFMPFVAVAAGVEHRFGTSFFVALLVDVAYAGGAYRHAGAGVALSWSWY